MEGKSLNNEPQEKTKTECMIEAIAMLSNLDRMFIKEIKAEKVKGLKLRREVERSYFTPQETFAKQCEIRKITQPFEKKAFAESEAKRLKYLLDKVFSLLAKAEYFLHTKKSPDESNSENENLAESEIKSECPAESEIKDRFPDAYNKAGKYIQYLNLITEPKQNKTEETHDSFKKSPGRPPKHTHPFTYFLSCSEEDKKKVIDVIKNQFKTGGGINIVYTCLALKEKNYFNWPKPAEAWGALRLLIGCDITTNSNLNSHYKKITDNLYTSKGDKNMNEWSVIDKISKILP